MNRGKALLLIDDDEAFTNAMVPLLERRGFRVQIARSGAEGTAAALRGRLDLVVVDGLLPDIDGLTWIARFREGDPETPLVFVSAFWGFVESLHRMSHSSGVRLVAHKPIDPATFCDQLERCLEPGESSGPVQLGPDLEDTRLLAAVSLEYARTLPAKLHDLERAFLDARAEPEDPFLIGELRRHAHRLRGTAGCYGFMEIGEAAGAIEDALPPTGRRQSDTLCDWNRVEEALHGARASGERAVLAVAKRRSMPLGVGGARVLVVSNDPLFAACMAEVGQTQLFEVVRADPAEAIEAACSSPPDAVLIDLRVHSHAFQLVRQLRSLPSCAALPVAFVSENDAVAHRVAAARAGVSLYLTKPVAPAPLGLAVRQLLTHQSSQLPRVLLLHEDPSSAERLAGLLGSRRMDVTTRSHSRDLLAVLDSVRPNLLLVDGGLPGLSGADLCRVLRTNPGWQDLPVVMMSDRGDPRSRISAVRAGVDDYLTKPVVEEELVARLEMRLERLRLSRERYDKDALTGLPLRRPFLDLVARSLAESKRNGRPLTVALLDVDLFKVVNDRHGHQAGDRALATLGRVLSARFRADDLRGRWGGEEFVLAFPGQEKSSIAPAISAVLHEFGALSFVGDGGEPFSVTFSAGLASHPRDGASIEALLEVADRRLYEAKRDGRARIVGS